MCGLYGYIGEPSEMSQIALYELGIDNERRGKDSSGLAYLRDGKFHVTKRVEESSKFLERTPVMNSLLSPTVIGHTRLATHGEVNWKNAHPFKYGKWIFAHNGVISNYEDLNKELGTNYEVDSQVIGALLPDRIHLLQGYYAIVAINTDEPDRIYFWRLYAPLFVGISKDACFFSSIGQSLQRNLFYGDFAIKEAPNGSHGFLERGKMTFDVDPIKPAKLPTIYNSFWLVGPDGKGEYHAASNVVAQALGFQGRARSCPIRGLEQRLVC